MQDITESGFDYSFLDVGTRDFLRQREKNMKDIVSDAYYQIGKELKEAQKKLAGNNQYNGVFQDWYESLGFKKTTVYNYINYYDLVVQNLNERKQIEQLPRSLVYEIAKPSADPELKKQVLDGDITTHKEYKQLLAEKKNLEESNDLLREINEELNNQKEIAELEKKRLEKKLKQKPEVVEKEKTVEVVPEDIEKRLKELEKRAGDLNEHKSEVNNYQNKLNKLYEEINQLQEYKRKLKEENNIVAQRSEVVQGIRSEINKFRKSQGKIEGLLKKDVQLRDVDLYNINEMADYLNEMAEKIYQYINSQQIGQKGDVIDVN